MPTKPRPDRRQRVGLERGPRRLHLGTAGRWINTSTRGRSCSHLLRWRCWFDGRNAPSTAKNGLVHCRFERKQPRSMERLWAGPTNDGRTAGPHGPGHRHLFGSCRRSPLPAGADCASGTHGSGDALYMTLGGTSQRRPWPEVLLRWYGNGSVSRRHRSTLSRLGEGDAHQRRCRTSARLTFQMAWKAGGTSTSNAPCFPMSGSTSLTTYVDDGPSLRSGNGLVYAFDLDPQPESTSRLYGLMHPEAPAVVLLQVDLVNDLDLGAGGPRRNQMARATTSLPALQPPGVPRMTWNNVERIRVPAGACSRRGAVDGRSASPWRRLTAVRARRCGRCDVHADR